MAPSKDLGFVKLAIEKEGQLPLLTTFDQVLHWIWFSAVMLTVVGSSFPLEAS